MKQKNKTKIMFFIVAAVVIVGIVFSLFFIRWYNERLEWSRISKEKAIDFLLDDSKMQKEYGSDFSFGPDCRILRKDKLIKVYLNVKGTSDWYVIIFNDDNSYVPIEYESISVPPKA